MKLIDTIRSKSRLLVVADQAVFSGISFVTTFAVAHLLPPVDFGVLSEFVLASYLLISMGNALVIQPFQVSYAQAADPAAYRAFTLILHLLVVSLVALAVIVFGSSGLAMARPFAPYTVSACAWLSMLLLHDFFRKALLAQNKVFESLVMDVMMAFVQLSGLAIAYYTDVRSLSALMWLQTLSFGVPVVYGLMAYGVQRRVGAWRSFFSAQWQQARWLLASSVVQWWSGNLFVVAAGVFLGPVALGAFRLVQSLFGIINMLLQTYENYALPEAVRRFQVSVSSSKIYLRSLSLQGAVLFSLVVTPLVLFPEAVMQFAGGAEYMQYAFVVRGMALLYLVIIVGYPVRMAVRMLVVNHIFFTGYLLSFFFSLVTFNVLLRVWQLEGAILGLIVNQLILIVFWNYGLVKRQYILWK